MPHRSSVAMPWRLKKSRYGVTGSECKSCGALSMPLRAVCECGASESKPFAFSGNGEIVSYTTIHVGPAGFSGPYNIALIRLDEGPVVSGVVVDADGVAVGKRVKQVFRKLQ